MWERSTDQGREVGSRRDANDRGVNFVRGQEQGEVG